ncbi:amidohydrolase [Wolfiporia cocos MD-104 SS10]|uniref:Amidohydrolase n=1 Tax=Wolfiporia cocos (strain MD-104) TaxID=742152 RepID=A0A2H3JFF7_WOLCO|nr:amidohydrolase [Wolfiporia cocos MD-104 SS10]
MTPRPHPVQHRARSLMPDDDVQAGCFSHLFSFRKKRVAPVAKRDTDTEDTQAHSFTGLPVEKVHATSTKGEQLFEYDGDLPPYAHFSNCRISYGHDGFSVSKPPRSEKPPSYSTSGLEAVFRPEVLNTIDKTLEDLDDELRALSLDILHHPEIMWQERRTHDTLTAFMSAHGFEVTPHYLDLPTAWRAVFTHAPAGKAEEKTRVIGINSEMDALPGIGHACGHNLIAMAGVGVALAIRAALIAHDVPGKIILLGTPAEEGGGGKINLLSGGAYEEMDACLMCHPGGGPANWSSIGPSLASQHLIVEFFGHGAHAAWAPWEAQNALDAAFLAYSSVSVLRQQIKPTHRVHGIVSGKDWAPNIIPDYAKMRWIVRAPTWAELEVLRERVKKCFEAAAHATGCKVTIDANSGYYDLRQNLVLGEQYGKLVERYGIDYGVDEGMSASTDFGNVSYALPSLHPAYTIPTKPNGGNHTPQFTWAAGTAEAHALTIKTAKGLAATGFRVLDDEAFTVQVRKAWEEQMKA